MKNSDSTFARIDAAGDVSWVDQFKASLFLHDDAAQWRRIFGMSDGFANYTLIYCGTRQ